MLQRFGAELGVEILVFWEEEGHTEKRGTLLGAQKNAITAPQTPTYGQYPSHVISLGRWRSPSSIHFFEKALAI